MTADLARLSAVLADRYRIERELGQGGMRDVRDAARAARKAAASDRGDVQLAGGTPGKGAEMTQT
jgi:hypothetical protein